MMFDIENPRAVYVVAAYAVVAIGLLALGLASWCGRRRARAEWERIRKTPKSPS